MSGLGQQKSHVLFCACTSLYACLWDVSPLISKTLKGGYESGEMISLSPKRTD